MKITNFSHILQTSTLIFCVRELWTVSFERETREKTDEDNFFGVNLSAARGQSCSRREREGGWESDTHSGCELPCCAAHARGTQLCAGSPAGTADTQKAKRTKGES